MFAEAEIARTCWLLPRSAPDQVQCLAAQIAQGIVGPFLKAGPGTPVRDILHGAPRYLERRRSGGDGPSVSIYLASDAAELRAEFALRLGAAVRSRLPPGWSVEVDYFSPALPAAHFFVWTYAQREMKQVFFSHAEFTDSLILFGFSTGK